MNKELLDKEIERILREMSLTGPNTPEYTELRASLMDLTFVKEKGISITNPVIQQILGQIGTVLLIMNFERAGIITSKALGFVSKAIKR